MVISKAGAVVLNTGAGNQSVTGLGFTPKVVMFQATPDTANIVTQIANMHLSLGAFDGTNQVLTMGNSRNQPINGDTISRMQDGAFYVADPAGTSTPDFTADGFSLDADGFTINITDPPPIDYRFGYWAVGGDDIANVKVGKFQSKGSTGLQAVTGLGFQPDVIIMFASSIWASYPAEVQDFIMTLGFANGPLTANQYAMGSIARDGTNPILATRSHKTGEVFRMATSTSGYFMTASLISLDVDGFTIDWTNHATIANIYVDFIAIKGSLDFKSSIGTKQLAGTTGGTAVVSGLGFQPNSGLFASAMTGVATGSNVTGAGFSIGFSGSNLGMFMTGGANRNYVGQNNAFHTSHDQRIERYCAYDGSGLYEEASLQQWDADGFTLFSNKGNGAGPSYVGYLVMAGNPIPPVVPEENFGYII